MRSINVLIVEDEILIAETIAIYLEERGHRVTDIVISFEEAKESLEQNPPEVVLIDIRLYGERSGIDLARYLRDRVDKVPYVFLTSQYDRRIVESAMSTDPKGYLTKPIQKETLWTTVELAFRQYEKSLEDDSRKVHLTDGSRSYILDEKEILFINAEHVYIRIHLEGRESIMIRQTLIQVLEQLDEKTFVQCHRGFIVNMYHITNYSSSTILIKDSKIPISRSRKNEVMQRIAEYAKS